MITPWDDSYKRTKAIKTGAAKLEAPFSDLVDWLNQFYAGIGALNAWVETDAKRIMAGKSALRVAFEREAAVERLSLAPLTYNPSEQARVLSRFHELAGGSFRAPEMFVTFHAFEPLARWEANGAVSAEDLLHLKSTLSPDLSVWEIHRQAGGVTFFFNTDAQLAASEANGARQTCANAYADLVRRYDEFGYFAERPIEVAFSSKQSFDRDYHGSWFNFDR